LNDTVKPLMTLVEALTMFTGRVEAGCERSGDEPGVELGGVSGSSKGTLYTCSWGAAGLGDMMSRFEVSEGLMSVGDEVECMNTKDELSGGVDPTDGHCFLIWAVSPLLKPAVEGDVEIE
jgi:hypothetical protein